MLPPHWTYTRKHATHGAVTLSFKKYIYCLGKYLIEHERYWTWIGGGGGAREPAAKRAEWNGSFDHQLICNDTYCISSVFSPVDRIMTLSSCYFLETRASELWLHIYSPKNKMKKKKHPWQSALIRCVSKPHLQLIRTDVLPAGRKRRTWPCIRGAGVGAKYFSNSTLTLRAGTREQKVQQESVWDSEGEDRLFLGWWGLFHRDVSDVS